MIIFEGELSRFRIKDKLKLFWYNNLIRHFQNWRWKRQVKRENMDAEWLSEGRSFDFRPSRTLAGKMRLKDLDYGRGVIKRIREELV